MAKAARGTQGGMVVGYVRVSTNDQALSVAAQQERLTTWCAERGCTLVAIHVDNAISGGAALEKRLALLAALDALAPGMVLLATKRDRIARDAMNAAMIERLVERAGAKVATCDGTGEGDGPEAKLMRGMIDLFAEYERAIIKARITVALGHKKTRNERVSRHIPYGQQLSPDAVHLEPHAAEQAVIAVARKLHAGGLSSRTIAARLAEQSLYSRKGTVFTPSAILAMVAS
jgi:site-specific DNA recombinase